MKKLFKISSIFVVPFLILSIIFFSIKINFHDWKHGHSAYNMQPRAIDWLFYYIELNYKKFANIYFSNKKIGLDVINIQIPEKSTNHLLSEVPSSTKNWVKAYLLNNNKYLEVEVRHFGDNPYNFMFEQKNIRLKTKKSEMFGRQRYFEYKTSQGYILNDYIAKKIAKNLGLLVSNVRLVELIINNQPGGIFIERERLNENFLRRNKLMPVNLYKGEEYNNEKKLGLDSDLYNNPGLWSKIAYFNLIGEDEKDDLSYFLNNLKKADTSYKNLKELLSNENIDYLSNVSVYQTLIQGEISNDIHNVRLVIDPWSGKIYLIPHDVSFNSEQKNIEEISLDGSNNNIFQVLNKSSEFLEKKYLLLYKAVKKDRYLSKAIDHIEKIKINFLTSQKRDIGLIQQKYYSNLKVNDLRLKYSELTDSLKIRERQIVEILEKRPKASWDVDPNGFKIKIDGLIPVANLKIEYKSEAPKWIAIDSNNNSQHDDNDKIFFANDNNTFHIPLTLFANRVNLSDKKSKILRSSKHRVSNTYFKFFVENKQAPDLVYGSNKYSNIQYLLDKKSNLSVAPDMFNLPIISSADDLEQIIISGEKTIDKDIIYRNEVKIMPGTKILLKKNASIVFKNKVLAIGNKEKPIIFTSFDNQHNSPWGTIALLGPETSGSIFKNIKMNGGSGDKIENINYISMLSLHNSKNIILDNINLSNNYIYDDMMHIIYSKNIKISDSILKNANFDAIDIDISRNIEIENLEIKDSGNDALDLMESEAIIRDSLFENSKDKGISVGENSSVKILKSIFNKNNIGIASKDGSKVYISNSKFNFNNEQMSAYKKNWQYGAPGEIKANNVHFENSKNILSSKNGSEINISNSIFKGPIEKDMNVVIN